MGNVLEMKFIILNLGKVSFLRSMMVKVLYTYYFMFIEGNGNIYCLFVKELGMIRVEYMILIIKF